MGSLNNLEILKLWKTNILQFLDNILEIFPDEADLIVYRQLFENQIPIEEVMKQFCIIIIPVKTMIENKNEEFFLSGKASFLDITNNKVSKWTTIWKSSRLNNDDRECIWKWMNVFLNLATMYINNQNAFRG